MTLAMKRLKNLGWLALVFLVAILLYPMSLNVAALHSDLVRVDSKILETKREISFLQAELRTRASLSQLEEWNDLLYGYAPPTAEQFVNGEAALASISGEAPMVKPVMVAVSNADVTPAGTIGSSAGREENISLASLQNEAKPKLQIESRLQPKPEPQVVQQPTRTERLAKMDEKLLSDDFLRDIEKRAVSEKKRK